MTRLILLVEDNEDDIFLMKTAWKKAGVTQPLHVAEDGQQAINFLNQAVKEENGASIPGLILLDLKMPRIPGLEVLSWLGKQQILCNVPVVVLTSSVADVDVAKAYELGATSYFAKPGNHDDRIALVRLFDDYWMKRCILPPICKARSQTA